MSLTASFFRFSVPALQTLQPAATRQTLVDLTEPSRLDNPGTTQPPSLLHKSESIKTASGPGALVTAAAAACNGIAEIIQRRLTPRYLPLDRRLPHCVGYWLIYQVERVRNVRSSADVARGVNLLGPYLIWKPGVHLSP